MIQIVFHSRRMRPGANSQSMTIRIGATTCSTSFDHGSVVPCGSSMPRSSML